MTDDINERLRKLEEENRRLRNQIKGPQAATKPTTTYVALWKGNPVLRFDGNFRPFGIGLKKASVILDCLNDVKQFVEQNRSKIDAAPDVDPKD